MQAAFQEFAIGHVKLGMLGNAAVARAVCQVLAEHPCQVVVDPVLRATAGGGLDEPDEGREIMDLICAQATVVCPNLPELAALGRGDDMAQQAEDVLARHANLEAVLVTGGHGGDKGSVQDILFVRGGSPRVRRHERVCTINLHGTGCTLASALAAYLARGQGLDAAFCRAVDFTFGVIQAGLEVNLVRPGRSAGPLAHCVWPPALSCCGLEEAQREKAGRKDQSSC